MKNINVTEANNIIIDELIENHSMIKNFINSN